MKDIHISLPEKVKFILDKLNQNGFSAFAVGGCIRDSILGIKAKDWDICTSAAPEDTVEVFKQFYMVLSGVKHGTVAVLIDGEFFEITTYREDGKYTDLRHPENVTFVSSIEGDLARRDFTVNSMAYNDTSGLIDLFGGREDLNNHIIRCVGDPQKRFGEDALRILRALRFSARYGFSIEKNASLCCHSMKELLTGISAERKTSEARGILCSDKACEIVRDYSDVLEYVFFTDKDIINKNSVLLKNMPKLFSLRLGALVRCESSLIKMKISASEKAEALSVANNIEKAPPKTLTEMRRFVGKHKENSEKLLCAIGAVNDITRSELLLRRIREERLCCTLSELQISGDDLMPLGLRGAEIGNMLKLLLEDVICDNVQNIREELLERANKLLSAVKKRRNDVSGTL